MKLYRYLVAVVILVLIGASSLSAQHFTYDNASSQQMSLFTSGNPGEEVTVTIGGRVTAAGDEIGFFAFEGGSWTNCYGATSITNPGNEALTITAYGYEDLQGGGFNPGFDPNQQVYIHVYDQSTNTVYTDVEVEWYDVILDQNFNGLFKHNGLIKITKINAIAPPRAPETFTPADGTVGIALSGNMTWEDISDYADSYDIQISTDGVNADVADETGLATNSYAYSNLLNGTDYWWRVRGSLTGEGAGDWSAWQQVQTVLAPPSVFSPNNNALGVPTSGNLVWTSVTGAANYEWEIFDDMAMTNTVAVGTTANTNAAYAGLNNNTEYWWQVKAMNGANMSDWSTASKFTTEIGAVTLQSPVDASMMIGFPAMLEWVTLPGAVSYEIMVAEDAGFSVNVMNFTNGDETYDLAGLDSWTEYYWQVLGVDAGDNPGEWSAAWSFTTDLLAPMNPDPANGSNGALLAGDLMWGAVNGADEYEVTLATDNQFNNVVAGFPATVTNITAAYAGLAFDTEYFWKVEAKNANPASAVSATWSFRTRLDSPTLLTPADASDCNLTSLTLDWDNFNADYYNLQVATDDQFTNFVGGFDGTAELTAHEQILTGLDNATTYWWRVQAYKNGQFSGYSPAFEFTIAFLKLI